MKENATEVSAFLETEQCKDALQAITKDLCLIACLDTGVQSNKNDRMYALSAYSNVKESRMEVCINLSQDNSDPAACKVNQRRKGEFGNKEYVYITVASAK